MWGWSEKGKAFAALRTRGFYGWPVRLRVLAERAAPQGHLLRGVGIGPYEKGCGAPRAARLAMTEDAKKEPAGPVLFLCRYPLPLMRRRFRARARFPWASWYSAMLRFWRSCSSAS